MAILEERPVEFIDIRKDEHDESLREMVLKSLKPDNGSIKTIPTLLLYDERGLKLFEQITYLEEYYLTNAEIEILETHANAIAERIPEGSRLLELGSGNLRKVDLLLKAFERAAKRVEYFALDLSLSELERTFTEISTSTYRYVTCFALHGTYEDALAWLAKPDNHTKPLCVLSLGSSLGNFSRVEAARFLGDFASTLKPTDCLIIGLDACQDPEKIHSAYNDSRGLTRQFYVNGLTHANKLLGYDAFKHENWNVFGRYDKLGGRHEALYCSTDDVSIEGISIQKGEMLKLEDAYKYSKLQSETLWHAAGLLQKAVFANHQDNYHIHMLSPARVMYTTAPAQYASQTVPTVADWQELWVAWDIVTRGMIPTEELMSKPINLRNSLIFYLGHIPTFADIHITKATGTIPTEPASYFSIFARGIDPDVDNPELCHDHSDVPDAWPTVEDILDFQGRVRNRILDSVHIAQKKGDRNLGRSLWLAFEHEAMHLETFLYMLLQSEGVLPPPGRATPDFKSMAKRARQMAVPNKWFDVPLAEITIGLEDPEDDLGPDRYFGWDNERPSRSVKVLPFKAKARPITNEEYAHFLVQTGFEMLPASWSNDTTNVKGNDNVQAQASVNGFPESGSQTLDSFIEIKSVRTVYGLVPLAYAKDWPVMASYEELAAYAKWSNGRIPTLEEVRSIYNYVETTEEEAEKIPSTLISAVNGHLSNNGVEETPPHDGHSESFPKGKQSPNPKDLFIDLKACNVGFTNWQPVPVTDHGNRLCGQSDTGGAWEWTATPLAKTEGFEPMKSYPGYTADFFDGKHNIILGGSWATHPRIAGRKTFVNWYQRTYPYVWATARVVKDA